MGEGPLPDVRLATEPPSAVPEVDVVALPFTKDTAEDGADLVLGAGAAELLTLLDIDLLGLLELHGAKGAVGDVVEHLVVQAPEAQPDLHRVLLVGVGGGS